jgi:hypothetical protein
MVSVMQKHRLNGREVCGQGCQASKSPAFFGAEVIHGFEPLFVSVRRLQPVGPSPMSKRLAEAKWYGGTTRLVGAGTFLKTRPARSNLEPWQGQ